jgi:hypothetical protein
MASFLLWEGFVTFLSTALSIWSVVCMWIIFQKAWRKWWESLIPVWNVYVLFKIAGKKWWFWVLLSLPILWIIVSAIFWLTIKSWWDINEYSTIYSIKSMVNWILGLLAYILPVMAWITLPYWLTKKFGQSNWFYIGMLFLTPIFFWILAFSDTKYEWVEFNEKYSLKKWLLITLWVSLLIGCCDAWIKYYQYKDLYDYYNNFELNNNENDNIDFEYNNDYENDNNEIWDFWNKLEQIKCYNQDWKINDNPKRDEYWEIINCYNEKWEEEWKWVSYTVNWIKNAESNYKNWKLNWKVTIFNTDGTVAVEGNYVDDEYVGN